MNTKLELTDTPQDMIIKLSEGNPGAMTICTRLLNEGAKIDPDSALGGYSNLLDLDTLNIYGGRIWMLYKDVCKEDIVKTVAMLRANQLGILQKDKLIHAIDNYGNGINVDELHTQVKDRLPSFADA